MISTLFDMIFVNLPAMYFNGALICFFFVSTREHGFVLNPIEALRTGWPFVKAVLSGFVPIALLGFLLQFLLSTAFPVFLLFAGIGVLVSGVLLHRHLLSKVSSPSRLNTAIAVLMLAQGALFFLPRLYFGIL